jgi:toxin YoeB
MKLILWTEKSWSDYAYWQENDSAIVDKINLMIRECLRTPFIGLGKPEPLRGELSGLWSRRLTAEHRFVYSVQGSNPEQMLRIIACRFHYDNIGKKRRN